MPDTQGGRPRAVCDLLGDARENPRFPVVSAEGVWASPTEKNSSTVYRPGGAPSMATIILF